MEVDKERVSRLMAEGRYFDEAKSWYAKLFHAPMAERSYMVGITAIAVYMIWLSLITAGSLVADMNKPVPFIVRSQNMLEEVPIIQRIAGRGEDINEALVRYFLSLYVQMHESFSFYDIEMRENSIQAMSRGNVYNEYMGQMAADNPRSPKYIFSRNRNASRSVEILSVNSNRARSPATASVHYRLTSDDGTGKNIQSIDWVAEIQFEYQDLVVHKDGSVDPMKFSVTAYSTKQRIVDQP